MSGEQIPKIKALFFASLFCCRFALKLQIFVCTVQSKSAMSPGPKRSQHFAMNQIRVALSLNCCHENFWGGGFPYNVFVCFFFCVCVCMYELLMYFCCLELVPVGRYVGARRNCTSGICQRQPMHPLHSFCPLMAEPSKQNIKSPAWRFTQHS